MDLETTKRFPIKGVAKRNIKNNYRSMKNISAPFGFSIIANNIIIPKAKYSK